MIKNEPYPEAKILIVDDEATSIRLLTKILSDAGYKNIKSTRDPNKVQKMYDDFQPDLLVLDLHMPHMEGFKIMDQLREIHKDDDYPPILVISQERNRVIQFSALEAGAKDFLVKPYDSIEVLLRIRNFLEVRMLHKQVREQKNALEKKVQERSEQLYIAEKDVIERLSRALEYRDWVTGTHTSRMSQYCYHLAEKVGLSPLECEIMATASLLHDVGKIGIPDNILQKPGKLNPDEWKIMQKHTTIGSELLSGSSSEFLKLGQEIALTHHEKWDGSGYPKGLRGEKIPLAGRICGLCDVLDALTSKRPYKKAWPLNEALDEIKAGRGAHFDPNLVDCLFNILPKIVEIHTKYGDKPD